MQALQTGDVLVGDLHIKAVADACPLVLGKDNGILHCAVLQNGIPHIGAESIIREDILEGGSGRREEVGIGVFAAAAGLFHPAGRGVRDSCDDGPVRKIMACGVAVDALPDQACRALLVREAAVAEAALPVFLRNAVHCAGGIPQVDSVHLVLVVQLEHDTHPCVVRGMGIVGIADVSGHVGEGHDTGLRVQSPVVLHGDPAEIRVRPQDVLQGDGIVIPCLGDGDIGLGHLIVGADTGQGRIGIQVQADQLVIAAVQHRQGRVGAEVQGLDLVGGAGKVLQSGVGTDVQSGQLVAVAVKGGQGSVGAEIQLREAAVDAVEVQKGRIVAEVQLRNRIAGADQPFKGSILSDIQRREAIVCEVKMD